MTTPILSVKHHLMTCFGKDMAEQIISRWKDLGEDITGDEDMATMSEDRRKKVNQSASNIYADITCRRMFRVNL